MEGQHIGVVAAVGEFAVGTFVCGARYVDDVIALGHPVDILEGVALHVGMGKQRGVARPFTQVGRTCEYHVVAHVQTGG